MTQPAKIIKRYANRKLYDTERSCYVTLDEIAQMVKSGDDIQVIDNKSKDDLTAVTLAQIIVEEQKKVARMPLKLLRIIIQNSNDALGYFYQKRVADPVQSFRDDVEKRMDGLINKEKDDSGQQQDGVSSEATSNTDALPADESTSGGASADTLESENNAVRTFVSSATETFDTWQRNVDDRVREAFAKMPNFSQASSELEALHQRIAAIDSRLKKMETGREDSAST
jgi:polyhydroxyalkanoate synthesis repressor PhaR